MIAKHLFSLFTLGMLVSINCYAQNNFSAKNIVDANGVVSSTFDCSISAGVEPCIMTDTGLPAQVLPRSFSQVYPSPVLNTDAILPIQIPAFIPLYVFNQQAGNSTDIETDGWYQIGSNDQEPLGWIQAKDAIQWKQALVVSYTHPGDEIEGRKPVVMFDRADALQGILDADDMEDRVEKIYQDIEDTDRADSVISMEPKQFLDINKQLYFLPITAWKEKDIDGEDARLLEIAAAVPNQRGASTVDDKEYMAAAKAARTRGAAPMWESNEESISASTEVNTATAAESAKPNLSPPINIVFVIDTTLSMQPYIDETRNAVQNLLQTIEDNLTNYNLSAKFGLVGYRDSTVHMPKIEYAAKNYTPNLVSASELINVLSTVKATKIDSIDEAEEVFAGIETAIYSNWEKDAFRFIILIGDASGHDRNHPYNTTQTNHEDVKRLLNQAGISLYAAHLQSNRKAAIKDRPIALEQYAHLSEIEGTDGQSALVPLDTSQPGFGHQLETVGTYFIRGYIEALERLRVGDSIEGLEEYNQPNEEFPDPEYPNDQRASPETIQTAVDATNTMLKMSLIRYIGQTANPPKDIKAWVVDRDLIDPGLQSLKVHVVLTQNQLSSLTQSLQRVLEAMRKSQVSQQDFFSSLQEIAGQTIKNPEDIFEASNLAETGLLPKFIEGLPYRSKILWLDDQMFASMTSNQRSDLEKELEAKIKQYRDILASPDLWKLTNPDDPDSTTVYPLPLDFLP